MASPRNYRHSRNRRPREARAPKSAVPLNLVSYSGNDAPSHDIVFVFDRAVKAHSLTAASFHIWRQTAGQPADHLSLVAIGTGCVDAGAKRVIFQWSGDLGVGRYIAGWDCPPNQQPVYFGTINKGPNFQLLPTKFQVTIDSV